MYVLIIIVYYFNNDKNIFSDFLRTPQIGWNGPMRVGQNPADFGKRTINAFKSIFKLFIS